MSRPKGIKNTVSYPRTFKGDPVIDFWLAILWKAKVDVNWYHARLMWGEFLASEHYRDRVDALATCWWICEYVQDNWCD